MLKRSEFYTMMSILFIFMLFSVASAVSYQPQIIQPTKPYSATHYSGSSSSGTFYTLLDTVTGTGVVNYVHLFNTSTDNDNLVIRLTVDGVAYDIDFGTNSPPSGFYVRASGTDYDSNKSLKWNGPVYFKSSLKIEVKQVSGSAQAIWSVAEYALE